LEKEKFDWTALVPEQKIDWEVDPETKFVIIKKTKFKNPLLKKYLLPKLKRPNYSIKLDKIGSYIWQKINGKNTFADIAENMRKEFGESVEPVNDRLGQFINSLRRYEFITFLNMDEIRSRKP
jgi:hypothetical protein